MYNKKKIIKLSSITTLLMLSIQGCTTTSLNHNNMSKEFGDLVEKQEINENQNSYLRESVKLNKVKSTYIEIKDSKKLKNLLKELEAIDGKLYYLKSEDISVPTSNFKIYNFNDLKTYLKDTLGIVPVITNPDINEKSIFEEENKINELISKNERLKIKLENDINVFKSNLDENVKNSFRYKELVKSNKKEVQDIISLEFLKLKTEKDDKLKELYNTYINDMENIKSGEASSEEIQKFTNETLYVLNKKYKNKFLIFKDKYEKEMEKDYKKEVIRLREQRENLIKTQTEYSMYEGDIEIIKDENGEISFNLEQMKPEDKEKIEEKVDQLILDNEKSFKIKQEKLKKNNFKRKKEQFEKLKYQELKEKLIEFKKNIKKQRKNKNINKILKYLKEEYLNNKSKIEKKYDEELQKIDYIVVDGKELLKEDYYFSLKYSDLKEKVKEDFLNKKRKEYEANVGINNSEIKKHQKRLELNKFKFEALSIKEKMRLKNKIHLVELKEYESLNYTELSEIPLKIDSKNGDKNYSLEDILMFISKSTGFNVILEENDNNSAGGDGTNNAQTTGVGLGDLNPSDMPSMKTKIQLYSDNVLNALEVISNKFNLFYTIDYKKKIILFSKYKSSVFNIDIPIIKLKASSGNKEGNTNTGTSVNGASSSTDLSINIIEEFEKTIQKVIESDSMARYSMDPSAGILEIYAKKKTTKIIQNIISKYEDNFKHEIEVELEVLSIALKKGYEYGTTATLDTSTNANGIKGITGIVSGSLVQDFLKFEGTNGSLSLKANNSIGKIVNINKNNIRLKNNIPSVQNLTTTKKYLSKIETTITDGTTTTTARTTKNPEIDSISEGVSILITPKIVNSKIYLNVVPNIVQLNSLNKEIIDTNTGDYVTLPDFTTQSFSSNVELKDGEKAILGSIIQHSNAKEYSGILPLEDYIVGGDSNNQFIRKEIVYIIKAKIIK